MLPLSSNPDLWKGIAGVLLSLGMGIVVGIMSVNGFQEVYAELLDYEKSTETYSTGEKIITDIYYGFKLVVFFFVGLFGMYMIAIGLLGTLAIVIL